MTLVGGSIPETSDDKLYNTCCIYGPDGNLLGKHRKVTACFSFAKGTTHAFVMQPRSA